MEVLLGFDDLLALVKGHVVGQVARPGLNWLAERHWR